MSQSKWKLPSAKSEIFLVVEDSVTDQFVIRRILEKLGYHVLVAENGREGIEALQFCAAHNLRPVGIASDILMPEMDGLEFLKHVRTHRDYRSIPFLFLTGVGAEYIWDAKRYGAQGYLTKPVVPDDLVAKLNQIFPDRGHKIASAA